MYALDNQTCAKCHKAVFAAEQVMGPGRKYYHQPCLSCSSCDKRLDSFMLLEHDSMPYCKVCHAREFGSTTDSPKWTPRKRDPSASPSKWGGAGSNPKCPRCDKAVYFAEQTKAVGKIWHKGCLKCTECSTFLDSHKLRDHGGQPVCSKCYDKKHGPAGGGYALAGRFAN
ncbi:hypothetical protein FISHEDRAFT_74458 [Fistulina hepatica ATCC 64428]|uniref:Cysteine-rich protein 1 n=1 Tax=Fistulina hepatica ATCC 64428 TaxID=1128425 RepID=A0A0D7ACI9_9AGAR|nr:hypothetical protein FISHEDRAFT_74458 [Fistulina hepatica ATCC 64428]